MPFVSLYRKHRPQSFSELAGQEAVSTALRNALREERVGHAYLFSGPRGTGKTTTARLLAKALNCRERGVGDEPCNACSSCVEITAGTSMDVLELDAASNRGISEMRGLLERVAYRSAGGDRKVYIIDEVHMLTKEASGALLKTLEEPPEHVVFVLATTDPQMVLPTIKSRTQHFEFSLLGADLLAAHLAEIARREGIDAAPDAIDIIARRAGGSARDALSLLDQALAHGEGALDAAQVRNLFGGTPFLQRTALVESLCTGDVPGLLERLDGMFAMGVDARQLADDLLRHLRDAFLLASAGNRVRTDLAEEERGVLAAQGQTFGAAALVRALESIGEAVLELRRAPDPRLILEVALVRVARRDVTSLEALADRLTRLEGAVAAGSTGAASAASPAPAAPAPAAPAPRPAARTGPGVALGALRSRPSSLPPAVPDEPAPGPPPSSPPASPAPTPATTDPSGPPLAFEDVQAAWSQALGGFKPRLRGMAQEAVPLRWEDGAVVLGVPSRFQKVHLPTIAAESGTIAAALSDLLGRPVRVKVMVADDTRPSDSGAPSAEDSPDDLEADFRAAAPPPGGGRPGVDSPVALAIEAFGATVESEIVRE